jgi:hypothetical protein
MNTLFTIVIVACTIVGPGQKDECDYYDVPAWLKTQLPMSQWMEAQEIVAQWAVTHPARRIEKWRLVRGKETGA